MKEHLEELKLGGRPMTKLELANKEIERLHSIIKEVRELLKNDYFEDGSFTNYEKVFELLDKDKQC